MSRKAQVAERYARVGWARLEMEERAYARTLVREGFLRFGQEYTDTGVSRTTITLVAR